jgi:hypothetical protein
LSDYELLSRSSSFSPSSEGVVQAVQMILESVRNINMSKETADKMIWVFLQNWGEYTSSMISQIDQQCSRFHRLHSAFQTTPHIVYWNFHSKTISPFFSLIPVDSVGCGGGDVGSKHQLLKERTTFFSGFSTSFIDYLCFMGNSIFGQSNVRDSTPYQTIRQLFHHPHYAVYEKIFKKIVS